MRIFISIELPNEIKKNIENIINEFKLNLTPIKWVESKHLHITLKFLGNVDDNKINELSSDLKKCIEGFAPINIQIGGLGAFPGTKRPKVIWIGMLKNSEIVKKTASCIENELANKGYKKEEREFSAHITIGRIKEKIDLEMLEKHILKKANVDLGSFTADHISIMKSTLTPKGPIYEEVKQIGFEK